MSDKNLHKTSQGFANNIKKQTIVHDQQQEIVQEEDAFSMYSNKNEAPLNPIKQQWKAKRKIDNQGKTTIGFQRKRYDEEEISSPVHSPQRDQNKASIETSATHLRQDDPPTAFKQIEKPYEKQSNSQWSPNKSQQYSPSKLMPLNQVLDQGAIGQRSKNLSEDYHVANYNKGLQYFQKEAYRYKNQEGQLVQYGVFCENRELKKYGLGVFLYLEFIKHLVCFFIAASVLMGLLMAYNYSGTGLSGYPSSYSLTLVQTSLGNNNYNTQLQMMTQTIVDSLMALGFVLFIIYYRSFTNSVIEETENTLHELDPEKYIVVLSNINNTSMNPNQVVKFLNAKYKVFEVVMVYDYNNKIDNLINHQEHEQGIEEKKLILRENNEDTSKIKEMEIKLHEQEQAIMSQNLERWPLYLIVHFERVSDKMHYENEYKNRYLVDNATNTILRCLCCPQPFSPNLRFKNQEWLLSQIKLGKPDELLWQNLDVSTCRWLVLRIIGLLLMVLCLFITSSLIALSTIYIATTSNCSNYVTITYAQAVLADQNTKYCYCQSEIYAGLTNSLVRTLCESMTSKILYSNALQIAAALVSTVTNVILSMLIKAITKFMRPKSKSTLYSNIFFANFVAVLLNSVVLPLVLNSSIFGTKPVLYISFLNFLNLSNLSLYGDFDKSWYVYVAPYYINMLIVSIIMPLIDVLKVWVLQALGRRTLRNNASQMLQKEMNSAITSFEFDLAIKASTLLVYLWLVLQYASSIPILCPLFLLSLFTSYLCDKKIILIFSKRVSSNQSINSLLMKFLPFVFLFHTAFAIWSFTSPSIFDAGVFSRVKFSFLTISGNFARITYVSYLLALAALAVLFLIFDYLLIPFLTTICCCRQSATVFAGPAEAMYSERLKKENMLGSYKMQSNTKYSALHKTIERIYGLKLGQKLTQTILNGETSMTNLGMFSAV